MWLKQRKKNVTPTVLCCLDDILVMKCQCQRGNNFSITPRSTRSIPLKLCNTWWCGYNETVSILITRRAITGEMWQSSFMKGPWRASSGGSPPPQGGDRTTNWLPPKPTSQNQQSLRSLLAKWDNDYLACRNFVKNFI